MVRWSDKIPILHTWDIFDAIATNVNATETQTCRQAAAIRPGPHAARRRRRKENGEERI